MAHGAAGVYSILSCRPGSPGFPEVVPMNTNALQNALALLLRSSPTPLVEVGSRTRRGCLRAPSARLTRRCSSRNCRTGRSLIEIEGVRLDVKLPLPMRIGDTLQLEVLALEPRLTFALVGGAAGAASDHVAMSDSARNLGALVDRLSREATCARRERRYAGARVGACRYRRVRREPEDGARAERPLLRVAPGAVGRRRASARRPDAGAAGRAQGGDRGRPSAGDRSRAATTRSARYATARLAGAGVARPGARVA